MSNGESSYRRFLAGEKDAIVDIVSEYSQGLILFLNSLTKSTYLSEEIAEDTFCRLLIEKPEYKGKSSFKTWLYTIARNLALRSLKQRGILTALSMNCKSCLMKRISKEIISEANRSFSFIRL